MGELTGKRVTLGVTGGIAVYKAVELLRLLKKAGADVHVVMTRAATEFVQPLTFRELSYHPVAVDMFEEPKEWLMEHLSLAEGCDVLVVAPTTANTLAKIAHGIADNLLCTTVLATTVPVVFAPAADSDMWANPITQANVARLKSLGYHFVGPGQGELARGNVGVGRMSDPSEVYAKVAELLLPQRDWEGLHLLVTAGPTQEPIDPVRFISNRSSGKMGYALAEAASRRGAKVTLISGPVTLPAPAGVKILRVQTVEEMRDAALSGFTDANVAIGAAAPADYRVERPASQKIKKEPSGQLDLRLVQNPDIVAELGKTKKGQLVVAFAAETNDLVENAQKKLARKNVDMVVANDVSVPGIGFDGDENAATVVYTDGRSEELPKMSKAQMANLILDRVLALWAGLTVPQHS